jgi:hypothetical protein
MAERLGADCECGFTFTTPHGMEEAVAIVETHVQRVHPDMKLSREDAKAIVKKR